MSKNPLDSSSFTRFQHGVLDSPGALGLGEFDERTEIVRPLGQLVQRLERRFQEPQFADQLLGRLLVVPEVRPFHLRGDFGLARLFDGVVKESP